MAETDLPKEIVLADTATKLGAAARGAVIVTGSHGGRYAAYLTLKAHPRAVIHNDAGVGKDEAGIAVIAMAEALGVAAATASHASCRIGDAADMMARGVVSHANALARSARRRPGHGLPRGRPAPHRRSPQRSRPRCQPAKPGACSTRPDGAGASC